MAGTRRQPVERALLYAAIMGEASLDEVNKLLNEAGFRSLVESSYAMIRRSYVPVFRLHPPALLDCIRSPYTMAQLAEFWRKNFRGEWEFVPPSGGDEIPE